MPRYPIYLKKKEMGNRWNSERILSIAAILLSVGTFLSIVYQTNLIRKQQLASVLPYLEIWNSSTSDRFQLKLFNNGIGPAFVKDVRIVYKDSVYNMDPFMFFVTEIKKHDTISNVRYANIKNGRLIRAGEVVDLIGVKDNAENADKLRKWFANDDLTKLEIEYTSVYDERWVVSGHANPPIEIE